MIAQAEDALRSQQLEISNEYLLVGRFGLWGCSPHAPASAVRSTPSSPNGDSFLAQNKELKEGRSGSGSEGGVEGGVEGGAAVRDRSSLLAWLPR